MFHVLEQHEGERINVEIFISCPFNSKGREWEENSQENLHYDHFRVQETLTNIISGLLGEK